MNLIIVDDENIIVEDVKSGVDWCKLGIVNVYTASDIFSAKEIISSQNVSILLCDIEMPQGSGLELLSWVRENFQGIETIFLTCHADFNYAVEAVRQGSFDYMLKPVQYEDLEKVVGKAIKKIKDRLVVNEFSRIGKYWSKHQPILIEQFWLDILNKSILPSSEAILEAANERNIPFAVRMEFLPIYVKLRRYQKELSLREEKHLEYLIKIMLEKNLLKSKENGLVVPYERGSFFIIFFMDSLSASEIDLIKTKCEALIEANDLKAEYDLNFYIGDARLAHFIQAQADELIKYDRDNIAYENKVFNLDQYSFYPREYSTPDFILWSALLAKGDSENAYATINRHIDDVLSSAGYNSETLKKLQIDFSQTVYSLLKQKNIQAHSILSDEKSTELYYSATRSIKDLKTWIKYTIDKIHISMSTTDATESIVNRAKKYIKQNLDQDLCRTDIAAYLHLNPDYFTRIFGKEVGLSIPEFITQERLKTAKEMILNSEMSISEIASSVGYTNFSYFSKLFREMFGINPSALKDRSKPINESALR